MVNKHLNVKSPTRKLFTKANVKTDISDSFHIVPPTLLRFAMWTPEDISRVNTLLRNTECKMAPMKTKRALSPVNYGNIRYFSQVGRRMTITHTAWFIIIIRLFGEDVG